MKLNNKDIALVAILTSIMLIFVFAPINIGAVDMAFMALIPVIVAAEVKGLKLGIVMGLIFGICSFLVAFTMRSVLSPLFQNPLVSVLPRIFIGLVTYFVYKGTSALLGKLKLKNEKARDTIAFTAASAMGTVTNTVLVLGMLLAFNFNRDVNGLVINWALIGTILSTNFIIELIVTTIICPPISLAVKQLYAYDQRRKKPVPAESFTAEPVPAEEVKEDEPNEKKDG